MIYPSWVTARALLRGADMRRPAGMAALALVAAMIMTAWDTVMDPGMSAAGNWVWEQGGAYFGVPLRNYAGWLLTTLLVYACAAIVWAATERSVNKSGIEARAASLTFAALPVIVYLVHGIRYVTAGSILALHEAIRLLHGWGTQQWYKNMRSRTWRKRSAYFLSSTATTCPSMLLSELSAYCTRAFIPSKALHGFMSPVGLKPEAVTSILK